MSLQATFDRFKEIQVTGKEFRAGAIGLLAGLLLGLLIGWVFWPVEWHGSDVDALGSDASMTVAAPTIEATAISPEAAVSPEAVASADEGNIWVSLLLALLSIAAVVGGVYLLWRFYLADKLSQKRAETELPLRTTTSRPGTGETIDAYNTGPTSQPSGAAVYRTAQAAATKVAPVQPPTMGDFPPFDDDDLSAATPSSSATTRQGASSFGPSIAVSASAAASTPDVFADDEEGWEEVDAGAPALDTPQLPAASTQRTARAPGWTAGAGRLERYQTIDHFHAEFTAGMQTFDWTRLLPGAGEGSYVGEYGAGVSERHGMLNNDPDQVVAIEVYILDKSEDASFDSVSRIVLSEYAYTHLLKQFERKKDRLGPIVAQPNTTIQLETRQFVLLCTITDVAYSDEGIFKHVVMDMELKKKS